MGSRKRNAALAWKEDKKSLFNAKLNNCPTSPRKMRMVADLIRGKNVDNALVILKYSKRDASTDMEKLLLTAINNWQAKNQGSRMEDSGLFIKEIFVDGGRMLKRMRPAPQGRGYRVRKRSNHVTLSIGSKAAVVDAPAPVEAAAPEAAPKKTRSRAKKS